MVGNVGQHSIVFEKRNRSPAVCRESSPDHVAENARVTQAMPSGDRRRIRHRERGKKTVTVCEIDALLSDRPESGSISRVDGSSAQSVSHEYDGISTWPRTLRHNPIAADNAHERDERHYSSHYCLPS